MNSQAKPIQKPPTLKSLASDLKREAKGIVRFVIITTNAIQVDLKRLERKTDDRHNALAKEDARLLDGLTDLKGMVHGLDDCIRNDRERLDTLEDGRVQDLASLKTAVGWSKAAERLGVQVSNRVDEVATMVGNVTARLDEAAAWGKNVDGCLESDATDLEDLKKKLETVDAARVKDWNEMSTFVRATSNRIDGFESRTSGLEAWKEDTATRLEDVDRELVGLDGKVSTLEHEQKQISHVLFTLKHESRIQELEAENRKTITNANTISGSLRAEARRFDARMVEFERSAQTLDDAANFQKNALETLAASWMKQHTADHEELERLKTAFGLLANNVDGRLAGIAEALKPVDVELVQGESQTPSPNEFTVAQRAGTLLSIMTRFDFPLETKDGLELWTAAAMLADSVGLDWKAYAVDAMNNGKGR